MSRFFYRPTIGPEHDYASEKEFEDIAEESGQSSLSGGEPAEETIDDIKDEAVRIAKEIEKLKNVLNILPSNLPQIYRDTLNKIKHDILNPPSLPVSVIPIEDEENNIADNPPGGTSEEWQLNDQDLEIVPPPSFGREDAIIIGDGENDRIYLFPEDNGINVVTEEVMPLQNFVRESFLKDKNDMYGNFVHKLKLMIQQYMRELLYVAKTGGFDSYLDLYVRFDTPSGEIPKSFMSASDRIVKNQIARDQKTRLLNKLFNIDQTVSHLIANKVSYEQRQRYYDIDYLQAKDYIETQENDELRRQRLAYDKKYEQNMYNYYKYLTGSVILTDEILKTFLSEARGKSLLNKNGIDTQKGYKEEQEKQKQTEAALKKETESTQKQEEKRQEELLDTLVKAGKDISYSGTYGDKIGVVNTSGGNSEAEPVSGSNAEKIVKMALQAWEKRGPNSSNPIRYDMTKRTHKIFNSSSTHSDCSAFVRGVVMEALGIDVGTNTADQVNKNKGRQWVYSISDLQPGDLIYFKSISGDGYTGYAVTLNGKQYNVNHALIYLGNKEIVECTRSADGLRRLNFSSGLNKKYMEERFMGAFRL